MNSTPIPDREFIFPTNTHTIIIIIIPLLCISKKKKNLKVKKNVMKFAQDY
jgi:hypothetical protein